ncbi:MAG: hypothetical protein ABR525_01875 [Candidatus Limnocylindria bacterium]
MTLSSRSFLGGVGPALLPLLPAALSGPRQSAGSSLVQFWYGNRALHYECWLRRRQSLLELGLHFEADPLTNERLLGAFRGHQRAIHRGLGPDVRLEEWDRGWARIWESVPLRVLDERVRDEVAARLARYIVTLEPLLREALPADTPWRLAAATGSPRPAAGRPRSGAR